VFSNAVRYVTAGCKLESTRSPKPKAQAYSFNMESDLATRNERHRVSAKLGECDKEDRSRPRTSVGGVHRRYRGHRAEAVNLLSHEKGCPQQRAYKRIFFWQRSELPPSKFLQPNPILKRPIPWDVSQWLPSLLMSF